MPAYTDIDTVFAKFPAIETAVGTGEFEIASLDVTSVFINQASGLVDAYLSTRYEVPFNVASIHPMVTRITTDIAICDMVRDRLPQTPEWIVSRCEDAMRMLEALRDGKMNLPGLTLANTTGDQEVWSTVDGYHPVFSPVLDPLEQAVDVDRVDYDEDQRASDYSLGSRFRGCPW